MHTYIYMHTYIHTYYYYYTHTYILTHVHIQMQGKPGAPLSFEIQKTGNPLPPPTTVTLFRPDRSFLGPEEKETPKNPAPGCNSLPESNVLPGRISTPRSSNQAVLALSIPGANAVPGPRVLPTFPAVKSSPRSPAAATRTAKKVIYSSCVGVCVYSRVCIYIYIYI